MEKYKPLTDSELEQVDGGGPLLIVGACFVVGGVVGYLINK